jgi:aldehyde dehydrogenase family 7 member A1
MLAAIVMPDADLSMAIPAIFFGAVGTAGQRCTSTRRLYLHRSIAPQVIEKLTSLYKNVRPGDPLEANTLLGPLHTKNATDLFNSTISSLRSANASVLAGGSHVTSLGSPFTEGNFVQPVIAVPPHANPLVQDETGRMWRTETFAPILQVGEFDELEEAIKWNNAVPQGLSSSLWTRDMRNVGRWIGPEGSDCGIVNVNVGTSGAEIGAAFGGNKVSDY